MKKLLAFVLAMTFVLIATLSVSAAYTPGVNIATGEQLNNSVGNAKWSAKNGNGCFGYDPDVAGEFYIIADQDGKIFNWFAVSKSTTVAAGDRITAKITTKADVGIMFGATNIADCSHLKKAESQGVQYLAAIIHHDFSTDTYSLSLYNDSLATESSEPTNNAVTKVDTVALTGINGTDDITLAVDFTAEGAVKVLVNGNEVISKTGLAPYGNECGIMTYRNENCGSANQRTALITVDEFTIGRPQSGGNAGGGAADTGDATTVYLVVSALAVCATLAAVYVSRKKRIAE